MKSNVLMYIGLILIVIQLAILINITAKSSYSDSIKQSLDDSLERSMNLIRRDADGHFAISGVDPDEVYGTVNLAPNDAARLDEFKTNFIRIFAKNLDPMVDNITINIFGADEESGILSVEVKAEFYYFDGIHKGEVSSYKTMIVNKTLKNS